MWSPGSPQDPLSLSQSSGSLPPHSQVKDEVMKPLLGDAVMEPHCGDQMGTGTGSVSAPHVLPGPLFQPLHVEPMRVCVTCSPHPHLVSQKWHPEGPRMGPHISAEGHPVYYPQGIIQGILGWPQASGETLPGVPSHSPMLECLSSRQIRASRSSFWWSGGAVVRRAPVLLLHSPSIT